MRELLSSSEEGEAALRKASFFFLSFLKQEKVGFVTTTLIVTNCALQ